MTGRNCPFMKILSIGLVICLLDWLWSDLLPDFCQLIFVNWTQVDWFLSAGLVDWFLSAGLVNARQRPVQHSLGRHVITSDLLVLTQGFVTGR